MSHAPPTLEVINFSKNNEIFWRDAEFGGMVVDRRPRRDPARSARKWLARNGYRRSVGGFRSAPISTTPAAFGTIFEHVSASR